jgi:hypothetical protein
LGQQSLYRGSPHADHSSGRFGAFAFLHAPRRVRFQGRMIQLARHFFMPAWKNVCLFLNRQISLNLRQTTQKSRNPKSRFDF